LALYQQALTLCPADDKRQRAVIQVHAGNTMRQLSDFPAAREYHNRALQLAREVRDDRAEVNALDGLGWALMGQGRYDEAKKHLDLALAQAFRTNDRIGKAKVLFHLGDVTYRQGDSQATAAYGAECLALCQELQDKQGIAGALRVIGFSHFMREQYAESFHYHTQSKSVYAQIGDRWGAASGGTNQGESMRRQGKFAEAEPYYLEAMKVYDEIGNRLGVAIILLNLGHVHTGRNDAAEAGHYFRRSAEQGWAIGAYSVLLEVVAGVALLEARAGNNQHAAEMLGMVQAHHEYNDEIRVNSQPALRLLEEALGKQGLAAALERGRVMDVGQAVRELLAANGTA